MKDLQNIGLTDQEKESRKAERIAKREERQAAKTADIESTVDRQIARVQQPTPAPSPEFSFESKRPDNWDQMTADQKNKWNAENKNQILGKAYADKFKELESTYRPSMEKVPEINRQQMIDIERKKRNRKWMDVVYAGMTGFQGREVDPNQLPSSRFSNQQNQMLQEYKDVSERNRKATEAWEKNQYDNRMSWLKSAFDRARTPEEKKMYEDEMKVADREYELKKKELGLKQQQEKRLASTPKTGTKATPIYTEQLESGNWRMTNQSNPYSDLYYKLTGNSPEIINEVAKLSGYATDDEGNLRNPLNVAETERLSNTLLSRMFEVTTNENGERIATPKPGTEKYLSDISNTISEVKQIQNNIAKLRNEQKEKRDNAYWESSKKEIDQEYRKKINEQNQLIKDKQTSLRNSIQGSAPIGKTTNKSTTSTPQTEKSALDSYFEDKD